MKRFFLKFSIFLFLLFSIHTIKAFANPISLAQGLYDIKDAQLTTGIEYKVKNNSSSRAILFVIDSNQMVQQLVRFEPNSTQYTIKPLNYGDIIIVIDSGKLEFF